MQRSSALIALLALAGCVRHTITTSPVWIGAAAPELRARGTARLKVQDASPNPDDAHVLQIENVSLDAPVRVQLTDRAFDLAGRGPDGLTFTQRSVRIRDLLAGCPDGVVVNDGAGRLAAPDCLLFRARDPELRRPLRFDRGKLLTGLGIGLLATAPGFVVCAFECGQPWAHVSRGVLGVEAVGVVIAGVAFVGVAAFVLYAWAKNQH